MTAMMTRPGGDVVTAAPEFGNAVVSQRSDVLFDQTIPRALVHRAAVSEVFLTDLCTLGDTEFQVGAQWPRGHSFFSLLRPDFHDPMLMAETIRQAGLLIAHAEFGVPLDWKFIVHRQTFSLGSDGLRLGARPADIVLAVTCHDLKRRGKRVAGGRLEIGCYRDGELIGSGGALWSAVSTSAYRRLRGERADAVIEVEPPVGVAPLAVGRDRARDVALAPGGRDREWVLRVDQSHPVMFDHPVDHVPGMVTMEAARQAANLVAGRPGALPVGCDFHFEHYIELDAPVRVNATEVTAVRSGVRSVEVVFGQAGRTAAFGTVDLLVHG
ncbi:ScbA/BarX family gamma-butyrolactone biosynthesis protein [Amycolatopsis sp. YIM 10]|uniref:ScbA/BarX family gamma-butyrolactone biosynthesis protein n=1 Tax=Amycolatopsis sp. YIM 10 TaxID=2653857 RepID=UPI00128FCE01|nr:ScbA/BarX family gamma-butyrolactone biosynthesis protein [Amycolatopsis sp. YIM 10]QFU94356.1 A-factor biosynthesis hotdog domain protein [Amycolatopsis sp. YIM 10]